MKKNQWTIVGLGTLLAMSVVASYYMHHRDNVRIDELEAQLDILQQKEKQAVVDRRVSKQMEEIAFGQQTLSEERSREAIHQSEIAHAATLRSEAERQKALHAQTAAEEYAHEALESYQMVERQRQEAETQRQQAEHAKLVADTLNYISLGRTLGSQSYAIYKTGDTTLGNMLAYASYMYTMEYGGDLYSSSVFPALTQAAGGRKNWNIHQGSISRIVPITTQASAPASGLLTVSTYGEIFKHWLQNGELTTQRLMSNSHYCFRDAYLAKGEKAYAVSHTGHLAIIDNIGTATATASMRILPLENIDRPFSLQHLNDGQQLLVVGKNSAIMLDIATDKVIGTRCLDFRVVSTSRRDHKPLLFDDRGCMHLVNSLDDMTNEVVPIASPSATAPATAPYVTAFASSKNEHLAAYGMSDGTIWLIDDKGRTQKLVAHLSQVTKMSFNGRRLYSSSYDGKLLFWMVGDSQIKPITLFQSASWLNDFAFANNKNYIWTGEFNGTISQYLISLPQIAQRIRQNVERNFTQEEWNYYVGKGIPYRKVKSEE